MSRSRRAEQGAQQVLIKRNSSIHWFFSHNISTEAWNQIHEHNRREPVLC
jgi:hypothetical protein